MIILNSQVIVTIRLVLWMARNTFSGFPDKGLEFFAQLDQNNNREWFLHHKQEYLDYVVAPAREFVMVLGDQLTKLIPQLQYDPSPRLGSIMRIYRDIRFSKDKTPYHSRLRLLFWTGVGKKTDNPSIYMRINHTGAKVGVGVHRFSSAQLHTYRQAVLDSRQGKRLASLLAKIENYPEYSVGGLHYKRVPRGLPSDHPRETLLRYKGIHGSSPYIAPDIVRSPQVTSAILEQCRKLSPIITWLVDNLL
jgi:uncharacterized protein (TIGR02453 family)